MLEHYLHFSKGEVHYSCSHCEVQQSMGVEHLELFKRHPVQRQSWALRLPVCECGAEHHLNCALPEDHPHPSAPHIRALVDHLHQMGAHHIVPGYGAEFPKGL